MSVTACLAGQQEDVEVREDCRTALQEACLSADVLDDDEGVVCLWRFSGSFQALYGSSEPGV